MNESGDLRIDQIMPELPERWLRVDFEDCLENEKAKFVKLKKKQIRASGEIPVVDQGEDFVAGYAHDKDLSYQGSLPVVIFGDHTRRIKYVDFQFAVGADGTKILKTKAFLDEKFFYYYLRCLKIESQGYSRHYRFLKTIDVPLPPLNEQHRIVEKLDKLLAKVDAARTRLARIPTLLKRFRQSVLAAAVSGELTKDWRERNAEVKDAAALLDEVKNLRLARHQEECEQARKRGQKPPKLEVAEDTPDFSIYDLPDLPNTWQWSNVSKFGFVRGGKRLPKGENLIEENTRHPYLRIRDLKNGSVDRSEILYVPSNVYPSIRNYLIHHGDVYLTIVGSIGDAGTIPPEFDGANLTENAARIVQPVGLIPEFLAFWFRSSPCQYVIQQNIHSGGQGKLALFRIKQLPVPVAPSAEQKEILKRVEALFKIADQIEARYSKAKAHVDKLTQAILAKAFRGELAPQDPNDEPAEVLLERIRKERSRPNRG